MLKYIQIVSDYLSYNESSKNNSDDGDSEGFHFEIVCLSNVKSNLTVLYHRLSSPFYSRIFKYNFFFNSIVSLKSEFYLLFIIRIITVLFVLSKEFILIIDFFLFMKNAPDFIHSNNKRYNLETVYLACIYKVQYFLLKKKNTSSLLFSRLHCLHFNVNSDW